jgi:hypothetical protein
VTTWYKLSPGDCSFDAFDHGLTQRGYPGSYMMVGLGLSGDLEPGRFTAALARAMEAHPVTQTRLEISRFRAWPYWRYDGAPVPPKYRHHDLSSHPDWRAEAHRINEEFYTSGLDSSTPPQINVQHYEGPGGQHILVFFCPHRLADVEGLMLFFREIERLAGDTPRPAPPHLVPDGEVVDPLQGYGMWKRLKLIPKLFSNAQRLMPNPESQLGDSLPDRPAGSLRLRYVLRTWSAEQVEQVRQIARQVAPPGPGLYARYLAGCVLRAVYRIYDEHGRKLPTYPLMFPLRISGVERRGIAGNFIVSPAVCVSADRITDRKAVAEDVFRQVSEFQSKRLDLASCAFLWLTSRLRSGQYRKLVNLLSTKQPILSGFTFWGDLDPPLERFLGTEVTDLWGTGVVSIPPPWNPSFNRIGDRIHLTLGWVDSMLPERVVMRFADLIDEEAFAG